VPGFDLLTFELTFDGSDRSADLFPAWYRTRALVYFQPRPDDDSVERARRRMIPGRTEF
jgi:hypothetical protein